MESQWVSTQYLFLYYYENKWLLDTKKRDLQKARLFSNLFCFIDDLCAINNHLEFQKNYKDIYPSKLEFKSDSIILIPSNYNQKQ